MHDALEYEETVRYKRQSCDETNWNTHLEQQCSITNEFVSLFDMLYEQSVIMMCNEVHIININVGT